MKKIIETIRGVMGVSGVVLWEKDTNVFHKLLPARLGATESDTICSHLARFCQYYSHGNGVKARFGKGWLWLHSSKHFALLILAKTDLNTTTLNLVVKSSLSTLESNMMHSTGAIRVPQSSFSPDHVAALARAINLALGHFQSQVSRFEIADVLRLAKNQLIDQYPVLKQFTVDANGGIIVIKGAEKTMDGTASMAAAQLISVFIDLIRARANVAGFDIEKVTMGLQQQLNEVGFYNYFASVRKTYVK